MKKSYINKNYFDRIPVRVDESGENGGELCIIHENTGFFNFIAQRLFRRPRRSFISLDKYGGFIWKAIDGKRSVYDIAVMFSHEFDRGSYDLTAGFIAALGRNGFIKYAD